MDKRIIALAQQNAIVHNFLMAQIKYGLAYTTVLEEIVLELAEQNKNLTKLAELAIQNQVHQTIFVSKVSQDQPKRCDIYAESGIAESTDEKPS